MKTSSYGRNIMRIVMVTDFPENIEEIHGGVESVAVTLANELGRYPDIELHIIRPGKNTSYKTRYDRYLVHTLSRPKLPGFLNYWSKFRIDLHKLIQSIDPDITHFQGVAGWVINYNKPHVLTIHGIIEQDILYSHRSFARMRYWIYKYIEQWGRRDAKNVIFISPYVEEIIGKQIKGKIINIPNPVEDSLLKLNRKNSEKRILYVGRLNNRKNILKILAVFKKIILDVSDAKLILAGGFEDEKYKDECLRFIEKNGLRKSIEILGVVDRGKLFYEFTLASCLILLSQQETAPVAILESMAVGVPVVASNICGIPYIIEHERTGYLVDQEDEDKTTNYLRNLLVDKRLNERMGELARSEILKKYSSQIVVKETLNLYDKILGKI